MRESVIRNGLRIKGTLSSGAGDNILTRDATTKDVGEVSGGVTSLTQDHIFVGNALNVPVDVAVSGDISIISTGVVSINPGVIVNADINAAAAIALTKLAPLAINRAIVSDGSGVINVSSTTATEIGFVSGVTSSIQTQLNAKEAIITGAASTITVSNLTVNRALISTVIGKVGVSTVLSTELAFLSGVTSSVQNQIDGKLSVTLTTPAQGDLIFRNGSGTWVNLAIGSVGQVLTVSGGIPTWTVGTSNGLPVGGTTGQYLRKNSNTNYDTYWDTLLVSDITDLTTTASELNVLDGITSTTTELNFTSGVTSSIQTQLNNKLNSALTYNSLFVGSATNLAVQLSAGNPGDVLTIVTGSPTWQPPPAPGDVSSATAPSIDNELVRYNGIVGNSIQGGTGIIISDTGAISFPTGGSIDTGINNGNTLLLRAYDVDGASYTTFGTLTAANTPTFDLNTSTTIGSADIYRVGGTDVSLADGGTGATLADPNADRILFWDDSAGQVTWLTAGTNLTITGTTINATSGGGGSVNSVNGTTDRITITGPATDPIVDIASTYVGQISIETLGVITAGTWQADVIDYPYGGTGLAILGTALQVLRTNAGATALEYATIAEGHVIKAAGVAQTQRASINVFNGLSAGDDAPNTDLVWGGQLTMDTDIGGNSGSYNVVFGRNSGGPDQLNSFAVLATDSGVNGGILLSTNLSQGVFISGTTAGAGKIRLVADQVYVNSPFVLEGYTTGSLPAAAEHTRGIAYDTTTSSVKFSNGVVWANISSGGTVTSVSGTLNRITSTGGTTPVIDISATFEALLGKVANPLSQFAATTSAQLAGIISDETGTGALVFATSPTLVTPALGTPSSVTLTNATGLPVSTGISGLGTGVATWLATPSWTNFNAAITGTAPYWPLAGTGTLTSAVTITSNTANQHIFSGTWTATANSQYHANFTGTFTSRATSADVLTGYQFTPSFSAAGTAQNIAAVRINPTWSTTNSPNNVGLWITVGTGDTGALPLYIETTAGARLYQFNAAGTLSIGSTGTASIAAQANGSGSATGRGPLFGTTVSSSNSVGFMYAQNSTNITDATVAKKWIRSSAFTYNPTSGVTAFADFEMSPTINQTSTATGLINLFEIKPVLTSVLGNLAAFVYDPAITTVSGRHDGILISPATCLNSFGAGLTPTAMVEIGAGTSSRGFFKFNSSTDLSSPAAGQWYYNGSRLGFSPSTTIKRVALTNDVTPSNGQIPIGNGTDYVAANITSTSGTIVVTSGAGTIDLATNANIKAVYSGGFSGVGTATTTFTVTIGATLAATTYEAVASPSNVLSAAVFYINNKTTTTFDVVYLAGLTGTVAFDWIVTP